MTSRCVRSAGIANPERRTKSAIFAPASDAKFLARIAEVEGVRDWRIRGRSAIVIFTNRSPPSPFGSTKDIWSRLTTAFQDHFSRVARSYAAVRPHYPDALFAFLASIAPGRELAWDAATGNGQAAISLVSHFRRVVATDASATQIEIATPDPRIDYQVARAEDSAIASESVDLITVAQAVHWFDLNAFYSEVRRVGRPHGVLAIWSYGYFSMTPAIDEILQRFAEGRLESYWPAASRVIRDRYRTLPFPFDEIDVPSFTMAHNFMLDDLALYFHSWSGVQRYIDETGEDPVPDAIREIRGAWGDVERPRIARYELFLRAGHIV